MTDRPRRVRPLLPWIVLALVLVQGWLGRALAAGQFGSTPVSAVFQPVLLWIALGIAVLVIGVVGELRGERAVRSAPVTFVLCCGGLWLAWDSLPGWLEVG